MTRAFMDKLVVSAEFGRLYETSVDLFDLDVLQETTPPPPPSQPSEDTPGRLQGKLGDNCTELLNTSQSIVEHLTQFKHDYPTVFWPFVSRLSDLNNNSGICETDDNLKGIGEKVDALSQAVDGVFQLHQNMRDLRYSLDKLQ